MSTNNTSSSNKPEKDYARLIAAQNESERVLKIKGIYNTLTEEKQKKNEMAIISGICFSAVLAATYFSGIDPHEALSAEIKALNSFDALKEYISMFTPAMWGSILALASSLHSYNKHRKAYKDANREYIDNLTNSPQKYQDIVESQAKTR